MKSIVLCGKKIRMILIAALLITFPASSAFAYTWTVVFPTTVKAQVCHIFAHDTTGAASYGSKLMVQGDTWTWSSGNGGKNPITWIEGWCEGGSPALTSQACDGTDFSSVIPNTQCSKNVRG